MTDQRHHQKASERESELKERREREQREKIHDTRVHAEAINISMKTSMMFLRECRQKRRLLIGRSHDNQTSNLKSYRHQPVKRPGDIPATASPTPLEVSARRIRLLSSQVWSVLNPGTEIGVGDWCASPAGEGNWLLRVLPISHLSAATQAPFCSTHNG